MQNFLTSYSNIEQLSEGGQKKVYKALHPKLGTVVIKVGKCSSLSNLERIKREIECLKQISSIFFPKNYDSGYDEKSNEFYIIEEFIDAQTLNNHKTYFCTEEKIIGLLKKLIEALKIIWEKNIVHRDLKPANILISAAYQPIIIDLGIARFLDMDSLTKSSHYIGPCTPSYASPEQLTNQKHIIDTRTDFFLIGIIISELYLGFHPFDPLKIKNKLSIPENIINGTYYDLKLKNGTSETFSALVKKLLKKEPFQRFKNYFLLEKFINDNWR